MASAGVVASLSSRPLNPRNFDDENGHQLLKIDQPYKDKKRHAQARQMELSITEFVKLKITSEGASRYDDHQIDVMINRFSTSFEILKKLKISHPDLLKFSTNYGPLCHDLQDRPSLNLV